MKKCSIFVTLAIICLPILAFAAPASKNICNDKDKIHTQNFTEGYTYEEIKCPQVEAADIIELQIDKQSKKELFVPNPKEVKKEPLVPIKNEGSKSKSLAKKVTFMNETSGNSKKSQIDLMPTYKEKRILKKTQKKETPDITAITDPLNEDWNNSAK